MADDTPEEHLADLDLKPNEASGLLRVEHQPLVEALGWDQGFWTVLDEQQPQDCVALLGHRAGEPLDGGWTSMRLTGDRGGDTEDANDAEALAHHEGWVYVFGSHHGGKDGPLRRRQHWIGRFREEAVERDGDGIRAAMEVVHTAYSIHRLINDAFTEHGVSLLPLERATKQAFIGQTLAALAGTAAEGMVRADDWPINIEGATFTRQGTLLLGLRFPVTAEGLPILVEVDGCAALFDDQPQLPVVMRILVVEAVGENGSLAGVRDMCVIDDVLHLVTGDLDSAGKGSVIRADYDEGAHTHSTHFAARLDPDATRLPAEALHVFADQPRIEGLAPGDDGHFFYVSDEDESVQVRATPLLQR